MSFTDGRPDATLPLPRGPAGKDGASIKTVTASADGTKLVIAFTDDRPVVEVPLPASAAAAPAAPAPAPAATVPAGVAMQYAFDKTGLGRAGAQFDFSTTVVLSTVSSGAAGERCVVTVTLFAARGAASGDASGARTATWAELTDGFLDTSAAGAFARAAPRPAGLASTGCFGPQTGADKLATLDAAGVTIDKWQQPGGATCLLGLSLPGPCPAGP